jgi:peptidyl-prolyl cis-trans isomerase SurA
MKTTPDDLNAKLAAQGIATETFRRYIATQIGFNRLLASRYRADIAIKPEDVDRKLAEIKQKVDARDALIRSDPRFKGATVYTLLEITLPVEANDAMAAQLLQARAVEAALVAKRFRGCGNAKAAAAGVFNVRFGKPVEVDAGKMPPQMRKALDRAGPGKAVGPMQGKGGIQLIAFCGSRKVKPEIPKFEMPTREQVENSLINEKYDGFEETYLKNARRSYYVEYRDPTVTQ